MQLAVSTAHKRPFMLRPPAGGPEPAERIRGVRPGRVRPQHGVGRCPQQQPDARPRPLSRVQVRLRPRAAPAAAILLNDSLKPWVHSTLLPAAFAHALPDTRFLRSVMVLQRYQWVARSSLPARLTNRKQIPWPPCARQVHQPAGPAAGGAQQAHPLLRDAAGDAGADGPPARRLPAVRISLTRSLAEADRDCPACCS